MPAGSPWPKVSIVTPSYNQGQFLEETIRSVLLQGYPNLEYIIIDGGSTDNSVEIIRKYEPWLTYWVSESDKGQAEAINKGWAKTTGQILTWLNADDIYYPITLASMAKIFSIEKNAQLVYANVDVLNEIGHVVDNFTARQFSFEEILCSYGFIPQQTAFFKRTAFDSEIEVNPHLHYVMDFELWLRIVSRYAFYYVNNTWAGFRMSTNNKTITHSEYFWPEIVSVLSSPWLNEWTTPNLLQRALREAKFTAGLELVRTGKYKDGVAYIAESFNSEYPYDNLTNTVYYTLSQLANKRWKKTSSNTPLFLLEQMIKEIRSEGSLNQKLKGYIWMSLALEAYAQNNLSYTRRASLNAFRVSKDTLQNKILWIVFLKALAGVFLLTQLRKWVALIRKMQNDATH